MHVLILKMSWLFVDKKKKSYPSHALSIGDQNVSSQFVEALINFSLKVNGNRVGGSNAEYKLVYLGLAMRAPMRELVAPVG